jgi:hypothetical protein
MPPFALFLIRHWQAALGLAVAAILAALLAVRTGQRDEARAALASERRAHALFAERVRARAEQIRADFTAFARRVERHQDQVTQEVSNDYQTRLAALRADHDRRLRAPSPRAHPGGAGRADLPRLPGTAGRADAAAPPADDFACRANSLQLEYLQRWVREQQGVEREPPVER